IIQNAEGINGGIALQNRGGGMYLDGSSPTVLNCQFNNNFSSVGGAIYALNSHASFVNCVVYENVADVGGALYNRSSNTSFTNCTFSNNLSFNFTGIFVSFTPSPTFSNCIIWANDGGLTQQQGANSTVNYSILDEVFPGTGNIIEDPLFVDPANDNFRLQASSCAIDNGLDSAVPAGVTTDLDGNPRFYNGGQVDIGAYEFQGP
ncbi:choice-of-anchor Q domain-containing protein, partial [Arthrospira platensis SPKY1]|nr:choice-of-anchor Q domain-containing protein [Arthrospira platensis SPKY1]